MEKNECFNCKKEAVKKLSVEPEFGQIYVCSNPKCKEKALNDIDRFQFAMQNQGRRKEQVEETEKILAYTLLAAIFVVSVLTIINLYAKIL